MQQNCLREAASEVEDVNYGKLLERWKALCFVMFRSNSNKPNRRQIWTLMNLLWWCHETPKLVPSCWIEWVLLILTFEQIKLFSKLPACSPMKAVYARLCMLLVGLLHQMAYKRQASEKNWICRLVWYGLTISLYHIISEGFGSLRENVACPLLKTCAADGQTVFTVATAVSLGSTCCSGQRNRCRPSVEFSMAN